MSNQKKGMTFYFYDKEDINNYFEFKKLVRRDKKYFNISNFIRLKISEYLENNKG